jgi:hypothetical protein
VIKLNLFLFFGGQLHTASTNVEARFNLATMMVHFLCGIKKSSQQPGRFTGCSLFTLCRDAVSSDDDAVTDNQLVPFTKAFLFSLITMLFINEIALR